MDFFKSVFSDDPEPSDSESPPTSPSKSQPEESRSSPSPPDSSPKVASIANAWTFGSSLFKTIASRSESVIETYRRDLEEFSSGLKLETSTIREAASRAVKQLPNRLETGAAAAQESLESVGQAIDNIGSTVSEIIAQGKDSILAGDSDTDSDTKQTIGGKHDYASSAKPYNRFDAQIRAIQCDAKTYCEEVEDLEDFNEWKKGFVLEDKTSEIEDLVEENGVIEEIYNVVVPNTIDRETFWTRYFYKVYRMEKAEAARAKLVKRAISGEEEELSWDVDDDENGEDDGSKTQSKKEIEEEDISEEKNAHSLNVDSEIKSSEIENDGNVGVSESKSDARVDESESLGEKMGVKPEEKADSEGGKIDNSESCKDSDISVVSSQPSHEEDLGWDEIEDIGSDDENKMAARGSPNRADLRKRLSAAEEDEDLNWDIEDDDDEPVKS